MDWNKKIIVIMVLLAVTVGLAAPFVSAQINSQRTVLQNLAGIGEFSTFLSGARAAGLDSVLNGPGQFTLFVPANTVFDKLPTGSLDALLKDPAKLNELLRYHAVPGKITYADLSRMTDVKTVDGRTLPINFKDGALMVGGTKVLNQGIDCSNGIIYPVDNIITPPGFTMPQVSKSGPLDWLWWVLGTIVLGAIALYLLTRGKKQETYEKVRPRVEEARPKAEEPAVAARESLEDVVLDESAVNEIRAIDKSRLAGLRKYIIGSYANFKNMVDFARDYGIHLMDLRNPDAAKSLQDKYALSPFNSDALELALEKNATIYTKEPSLMDKYKAAGAKTADIRRLIS